MGRVSVIFFVLCSLKLQLSSGFVSQRWFKSSRNGAELFAINGDRDVEGVYRWLRDDHVLQVENVQVLESPGRGYGIYAAKDIPKNTAILYVPLEQSLFPDLILKDPDMGEAARKYIKEVEDKEQYPGQNLDVDKRRNHLLPALLVHELAKGEKSKFYAYLKSLPWDDADRYLLNWNFDELCLLQGSSVMKQVYILRNEATLAYYAIEEILPSSTKEHFGEDLEKVIKAAFFLANSRSAEHVWTAAEREQFGIDQNVETSNVMVPLFDLLNHKRRMPSCRFGGYRSGTGVLSKRRVPAGEELTVSYGRKANINLFLVYDYVEEKDSSCWETKVPLTVHPADPLHDKKMEILTKTGYHTEGFPDAEATLQYRTPVLDLTGKALAQLRVLAMRTEEGLDNRAEKMLRAWTAELHGQDQENTDEESGDEEATVKATLPSAQTLVDASLDGLDGACAAAAAAGEGGEGDDDEEEDDDLLDTFYDLPRQEQKDVLYVLSRLCTERLKDFPESTASLGIDEARINPARKEIAKKIVGTELQVLKSYIITAETEDAVFESLGLGYF